MATPLEIACHLNVVVESLAAPQLDATLARLAELGYSAIVLEPVDPSAVDAAALAARFAAHGLTAIPLAGQSPAADVSSADTEVRRAGAAALTRMVEFAEQLGSDQLNGVPYGLFRATTGPTAADAFARSAVEVGRVADLAAARGITMTFEVVNRYEVSMLNTAAQALAYVAASESAALRIHLDTFHMAIEEADSAAALVAAVPKLGYLELGQSGRGRLATGSVDVDALVRTAIAAGYTGRIGIEAFRRPGLPSSVADLLAIWRDPYVDGIDLAAEAMHLIRNAGAGAGTFTSQDAP